MFNSGKEAITQDIYFARETGSLIQVYRGIPKYEKSLLSNRIKDDSCCHPCIAACSKL